MTFSLEGLQFQQEKVIDIYPEVKSYMQDHCLEIRGFELDLDLEEIKTKEDSGELICHTIRCNKGIVIGYATHVIGTEFHNKSRLMAYQDTLYVAPELRGKGIGVRLIEFCDGKLREKGIKCVYRQSTPQYDIKGLLNMIGYKVSEISYEKEL